MLYAALGSFAIAALLGMTMLTNWIQKKRPYSILVISKGVFAAIGFACMVTQAVTSHSGFPTVSLVFFILAALGGSFLLYNDLTKQHVPVPVALIHGSLALVAIVMLIVYLA